MSGARALPFLLMLSLVAMSLGGIVNAEQTETDPTQDELEYTTLPRAGGTVWVSTILLENAGDRFLEFVEPPEFTRTQEALANPDLVPGDKGDEGGEQSPIITQRRVTDYSYMEQPYTGGLRVENVHAAEDAWLCVCDVEFVMQNQDGMAPTVPDRLIYVEDSSRVWIDNITFYGGLIIFDDSEHLITSNSLFVDSRGILSEPFGPWAPSNHGLVHNVTFINQRGPLNLLHMPNPPDPIGGILSEDPMCWPHDAIPCERTGILLIGGEDWIVEWSHIHGDGIISASSAQRDTILRHNTLYDTGRLRVSHGTNEISWNLIRGNWASTNLDTRSSEYAEIHNNSIIRPFKISPGIDSGTPGLEIINCGECRLRNNDFIGFARLKEGAPQQQGPNLGEPAMRAEEKLDHGIIDASDNYWGTFHDPRNPEDTFIILRGNVDLILDNWHTQPTHPITPLVHTLDPNDLPYWIEQITGLPTRDPLNLTPLPEL